MATEANARNTERKEKCHRRERALLGADSHRAPHSRCSTSCPVGSVLGSVMGGQQRSLHRVLFVGAPAGFPQLLWEAEGRREKHPRAVRQGGITEVSLGCGGLSWGLVKWNGGFKFQGKQQFPAGAQTAYNYACSCEWGCTVPPKCPHLWGLLCLPTHGHVDLRRATCRCDRCQPLREEMLHFPTIPELRSPKHNSISTLVQFHPYFSDLISVKLKYNRGLRALLDNFKSNLTKISNPATDHWEFVQESYTQLVVLWFCSCSDTIIFNPNKFSKTFQQ